MLTRGRFFFVPRSYNIPSIFTRVGGAIAGAGAITGRTAVVVAAVVGAITGAGTFSCVVVVVVTVVIGELDGMSSAEDIPQDRHHSAAAMQAMQAGVRADSFNERCSIMIFRSL
jgi:hypothetical protein